MTSRINKIIARQQETITSDRYYEAHQQLRAIAARYIRQQNYDDAAEILTGGAKALLAAETSQKGAAASGGDLAIMLVVDVYNKAGWEIGDNDDLVARGRKDRLIGLLQEFPSNEASRKRFINEMINWSSHFGPLERGDPDLHHAAGSVYAKENEPYDAEKHLVLGTTESAEILAKLEYEWYTNDDLHTAAVYASRAVFPFLLTGNLRSANKAFLIFISRLFSKPSLVAQEVSGAISDLRVYPSLPLLNFITLLLLAIQRGTTELFRELTKHYAQHIQDVGIWDDALMRIAEMYFGIRIPKQGNPLFDMMSSMLFGGGQSGGAQRAGAPTRGSSKRVEAPPSHLELD